MKRKDLKTISYCPEIDQQSVCCTVSYAPQPSLLAAKLSAFEMRQYLHLLERAQVCDKTVLGDIHSLYERYQDIPELSNLLTYALLQNKEIQKAEQLVLDTYQKHPDYFFARLNYADQCLRKKQLQEISRIFPSTSLPELFPEKKVFHFTEFRGFMVLMGFYHIALGKKHEAENFYKAAMEADPAHLGVVALEKKLFPMRFFSQKIKRSLLKAPKFKFRLSRNKSR